jgi:hypothetical protein
MTLASVSSSEYFEPATINNNVYISGDNVAKSPALFAYLFTRKQKGDDQNIRIVSVGSVAETPANYEYQKYSLRDWFLYLVEDNHSLVAHTMDYMLRSISTENNHEYHKFEIRKSQAWNYKLLYEGNRTTNDIVAA